MTQRLPDISVESPRDERQSSVLPPWYYLPRQGWKIMPGVRDREYHLSNGDGKGVGG